MCDSKILSIARHNFSKAAKSLQIHQALYEKLLEPKEKVELNLCPLLSDGKIHIIKAFIVKHSDALGPSKGGIRMTSSVTSSDVSGLAMEMTWKSSLIGVPFGGGKAGICFAPALFPEGDKETVMRAFCRGSLHHIGPETYVPAPDIGTNEADMGHIRDCISKSYGQSITRGCFVTGKPLILGGIVGRREATGKGVVYCILEACKKAGIDIHNTRVAIQGCGNVGSNAAKAIYECGAKVIAIADETGGVKDTNGLDVDELLEHVKTAKGVAGYKHAEEIDGSAVFETDAEILIPAAVDSQITAHNVDEIKACIIAEGANAPTTPEADEILAQKGILVIPDILCNAGGVFVSYLEYTQETQREQMTLNEVEKRLCERMQTMFNKVYNYANSEGISMRDSAMNIAIKRVIEAVSAKGFQL